MNEATANRDDVSTDEWAICERVSSKGVIRYHHRMSERCPLCVGRVGVPDVAEPSVFVRKD